jgi:hypothetical protein
MYSKFRSLIKNIVVKEGRLNAKKLLSKHIPPFSLITIEMILIEFVKYY